MKTIHFPTCSVTQKTITRTTNFVASFSSNVFCTTCIPRSSNLGSKSLALFLTHCSTEPTTHIDSTTESSETIPNDRPNSISIQSSPSIPTPPSSKGLVFDLGLAGSWDSTEVGSPVVKRFLSDDEERWFMWYHGRSDKSLDTVGLAISSNGVHWQRGDEVVDSSSGTGIVMKCGDNWWAFDTKSIRPAEIMVMSSNKVRISSAVYWMYYTGFSSEEIELPQDIEIPSSQIISANVCSSAFRSLPGLAISQDGRNWARIEGDHHSGALFDVGSNGEWDSLFISSPHVVFHTKGDLRMYYHSLDPKDGKFAIGLARSRDGIKWLKLGKVIRGGLIEGCFDEMGAINPCVVKEKKDGKYLMAYEGVAKDGNRSIGLAVSDDGLKDWKRVGDKPVFEASSDNGWDSKGVGCPCLVQMDGDEDLWRLYYTGIGLDNRTRIGLAVSNGNDITCFRRWVNFHL